MDMTREMRAENDFQHEDIREIYGFIWKLHDHGRSTQPADLLGQINDPARAEIVSAAANRDLGAEDSEQLLIELISLLRQHSFKKQREIIVNKIRQAQKNNDDRDVEELTRQLKELMESHSSAL